MTKTLSRVKEMVQGVGRHCSEGKPEPDLAGRYKCPGRFLVKEVLIHTLAFSDRMYFDLFESTVDPRQTWG